MSNAALGFGPLARAVADELFDEPGIVVGAQTIQLGAPCPICGDPMLRKTITSQDGTALTHDRCDDCWQSHPIPEPPR